MRIEITLECLGELADIIEFKDKNGKVQILKLEEDAEAVTNAENTFVCEDAYFLGEDAENYNSELDYVYENIEEICNDFQAGVYFKSLEMKENEQILLAEVSDEDENAVYKKLIYHKPEIRENNQEQIVNKDIKNKDNSKPVENKIEYDNNNSDINNDESLPTFEECDIFGISSAERKYYENQKVKEQIKEQVQEQSKQQEKEKTISQVQSYGDEFDR